jgi:DNA helicase-2/ATP-dependent DNA helicase PcrA
MQLNPQQQAAVTTTQGPVVIVAGPGTGKTKTLAERIKHLVEDKRVAPQQILALTFTKKAAQEMVDRVGTGGVVISTFHALCNTILGGQRTFVSEPERLHIIKLLPKDLKQSGIPLRDYSLLISLAKNKSGKITDPLVNAYNQALHARGLVDFDDLLLMARDLLASDPTKKPNFTYVLVDEFQDTNSLQYELLRLLLSNDNIFIIGDPKQSIYGFRGADSTIFDAFKKDFPHCKHIELTINYRSAPQVVALANAIFPDGPNLIAHRQSTGDVQALKLLNEYSEAQWVVDAIQAAIGGSNMNNAVHHDNPASLKDFAILYRNRHVAKTVQKYIADSGLPYQVVGEGSPYLQAEVQTLIAILRSCHNPPQAAGMFTEAQVEALLPKIDTSLPPVELAEQIIETFAIKKTAAISSFIGIIVRFTTLSNLMQFVNTISSQDFYDASAEAITLLTIHASKGLEFPHVFLIAAEEGNLPSAKADPTEERRLFYVAATRAKSRLDITHVTRRSGQIAEESRFSIEIPAHILPKNVDPNLQQDLRRLQKRQTKRAQSTLF